MDEGVKESHREVEELVLDLFLGERNVEEEGVGGSAVRTKDPVVESTQLDF